MECIVRRLIDLKMYQLDGIKVE